MGCYDRIHDDFTPADWARKYGKDWVFADQPCHMAYFDRLIVNDPIEAGSNMTERWTTDTMRELNDWNASEFAKRPARGTLETSRERMHAERKRQRALLSAHTDAHCARDRDSLRMRPRGSTSTFQRPLAIPVFVLNAAPEPSTGCGLFGQRSTGL